MVTGQDALQHSKGGAAGGLEWSRGRPGAEPQQQPLAVLPHAETGPYSFCPLLPATHLPAQGECASRPVNRKWTVKPELHRL